MSTNQSKGTIKHNWGGIRHNAGRKKKYGEPTKVMTFRVPLSKVNDIREAIKYILNIKNETEDFNNNF